MSDFEDDLEDDMGDRITDSVDDDGRRVITNHNAHASMTEFSPEYWVGDDRVPHLTADSEAKAREILDELPDGYADFSEDQALEIEQVELLLEEYGAGVGFSGCIAIEERLICAARGFLADLAKQRPGQRLGGSLILKAEPGDSE